MREDKAQRHTSEERSPCEINHLFDGVSCVEAAKEKVDGLLLCERHALEVKLEGQISCLVSRFQGGAMRAPLFARPSLVSLFLSIIRRQEYRRDHANPHPKAGRGYRGVWAARGIIRQMVWGTAQGALGVRRM
jgi:hypothetical protein